MKRFMLFSILTLALTASVSHAGFLGRVLAARILFGPFVPVQPVVVAQPVQFAPVQVFQPAPVFAPAPQVIIRERIRYVPVPQQPLQQKAPQKAAPKQP